MRKNRKKSIKGHRVVERWRSPVYYHLATVAAGRVGFVLRAFP